MWRWSGVVSLCSRCWLLGGAEGCSDNSTVYLSNPGVARCPRQTWLVMALFFAYMLITAIMLVNLLIAIFRFNSLLEHCAQTTTSSSVAEGPRDAG